MVVPAALRSRHVEEGREMLHSFARAMALIVVSAAAASAQTVDDIIAKNLEAKGGLAKIRAVETLRMTGTMTVGPNMEAPFVMEFKRPGRLRMDVTVQGTTITQAFDGKLGWMANPLAGPAASVAPPDAQKVMEEQSDFDGPLVDYKAKGHKIVLVGKEKAGQADAYKLQLLFKNGDVRYYYLDATSCLEIRVEGKTNVRGKLVNTVGIIGDYKPVDGLVLPHSMESVPQGGQNQKMTVTKVEVNPAIEDGRFRMPGK
jgi:outer membrane lipoprotein-sorting protein